MISTEAVGFDEAIDKWIKKIEEEKSHNTWDSYRRSMKVWRRFAPKFVTDLTKQDLNKWLEYLRSQHLNPNSIKTYTYHLTSLFNFIEDYYDLDTPLPAVRPRTIKGRRPIQRFFTKEEYQLILLKTKGKARDLFMFLANTGLRRDELMRVQWSDIHDDYLYVIGKGGKHRLIDLNKTVRKILDRYDSSTKQPAFIERYARTVAVLDYLCKTTAERCGIKRFGPHAFRHYYATELMRCGVPLKKISLALGHSSILVTEKVYIHATFDDVKGINSVLDN